MEKNRYKEISKNLTADRNDYMSAFRKNIDMYVVDKDITLSEIAESADLPFSTLRTFLYGNSSDCKLSTAVKLARAFGISIDELVGAETISQTSRESIAICRNLPENAVYLIRWYIRYIDGLNRNNEPNKRYISVMELECNLNGNLRITTNYRHIDITDIEEDVRSKVFFGVTMPCDHYMPHYSPYDILLIANDRMPMPNENCLIRVNKSIYIARLKMDNGKMKFYSIRDGKFRLNESEVDEIVGYIAATIVERENN